MPRLGLGIHEFRLAEPSLSQADSWTPRPSLGVTERAELFLRRKVSMSLESLKSLLPDYAKDLKLNLSSLASETALTQQQLAGTFIVSALASRQPQVIAAINDEFAAKLEPAALNAAKAAAAIMGMNNIYYRFVHLAGGDYKKMPARLRMNVMANP